MGSSIDAYSLARRFDLVESPQTIATSDGSSSSRREDLESKSPVSISKGTQAVPSSGVTWQGREISKIYFTIPVLKTFYSHGILYCVGLSSLLEIDDLSRLASTCRLTYHGYQPPHFENIENPQKPISLTGTLQNRATFPHATIPVRASFLKGRKMITEETGEAVKRLARQLHLTLPTNFTHKFLYPFSDQLVSIVCPPESQHTKFLHHTLTMRHAQRKKFENVECLKLSRGFDSERWRVADWNDPTGLRVMGASNMFPKLQKLSIDCRWSSLAQTMNLEEWLPRLDTLSIRNCSNIDNDPFPQKEYPLQVLNLRSSLFLDGSRFLKLFPRLQRLRQFEHSKIHDDWKRTLSRPKLEALLLCPHLRELSVGRIDLRKIKNRPLRRELSAPGTLSVDNLRKLFPSLALKEGTVDIVEQFQDKFGKQLNFIVYFLNSACNSSGDVVLLPTSKRVEGFGLEPSPVGSSSSSSSKSDLQNQRGEFEM